MHGGDPGHYKVFARLDVSGYFESHDFNAPNKSFKLARTNCMFYKYDP